MGYGTITESDISNQPIDLKVGGRKISHGLKNHEVEALLKIILETEHASNLCRT